MPYRRVEKRGPERKTTAAHVRCQALIYGLGIFKGGVALLWLALLFIGAAIVFYSTFELSRKRES